MKFLEGSHKYKPNIYLSKNLGEFLGKFHKKIHNYKPVYYSKVSPSLSWNKLYYDLDSQLQNYPLKKYRDKIRNRMPCLLKTKYNNIPMGAIHNDFHQYNILFKDNKIIGLIDFQSFYGPLIYDIASAIVRFCFTKKGTINKVNLYQFIESYEKYRKITPEEKQILSEAIKFNILYVIEYFIPKGKRMPENYFDELELYFKMFDNINENKLKI